MKAGKQRKKTKIKKERLKSEEGKREKRERSGEGRGGGNSAASRPQSQRGRVCEYLDAASRQPGAAPVCDFLARLDFGKETQKSGLLMDPPGMHKDAVTLSHHSSPGPANDVPAPSNSPPELLNPRGSDNPNNIPTSTLHYQSQRGPPETSQYLPGMAGRPSHSLKEGTVESWSPRAVDFLSINEPHSSSRQSSVSTPAGVCSSQRRNDTTRFTCGYLRQSTSSFTTFSTTTTATTTTTTTFPTAVTSHDSFQSSFPIASTIIDVIATPATSNITATITTTTAEATANTCFTTTPSSSCPFLQKTDPITTTAKVVPASTIATVSDNTNTAAKTIKCPFLQDRCPSTLTTTTTTTTNNNNNTNTNTGCQFLHRNTSPRCHFLHRNTSPVTTTAISCQYLFTTTATTTTTNNNNNNNDNNNTTASPTSTKISCQYLLTSKTILNNNNNTTTHPATSAPPCQYLFTTTAITTTNNNNNNAATSPVTITTTCHYLLSTATNNNNNDNPNHLHHRPYETNRSSTTTISERNTKRDEGTRNPHLEEHRTAAAGRGTRGRVGNVTSIQTKGKVLRKGVGVGVNKLCSTRENSGRVGQLVEKSNISGETDEDRVNILPLEARDGGRSTNTGHLAESPIESSAGIPNLFSSVPPTVLPSPANHRPEATAIRGHNSSLTGQPPEPFPRNVFSRKESQNEIFTEGERAPKNNLSLVPKNDLKENSSPEGRLIENAFNGRQNLADTRNERTRITLNKDAALGSSSLLVEENERVHSESSSGGVCHFLHGASEKATRPRRLTCEFIEKINGYTDNSNRTNESENGTGQETKEGEKEEQLRSLRQDQTEGHNKAPISVGKTPGDCAKFRSQFQQKFTVSSLLYQTPRDPLPPHCIASPNSVHSHGDQEGSMRAEGTVGAPGSLSCVHRHGEATPTQPRASREHTPRHCEGASITLADRNPPAGLEPAHASPIGGRRASHHNTSSLTEEFHRKSSFHCSVQKGKNYRYFFPSPILTSGPELKMKLGPCPASGKEDEDKTEKAEEELSDTSGSAALEEYDPRLIRSRSGSPSDETRTNDLELPPAERKVKLVAEEKTCRMTKRNSLSLSTPDELATRNESFRNEEIYQNIERTRNTTSRDRLTASHPRWSAPQPVASWLQKTWDGAELAHRPVTSVIPGAHSKGRLATPVTTQHHAKTCGFLLRVQEVLRSLPGTEMARTAPAPETVTSEDK
ncbi:hypothetical protein E2C01_052073 [Portunus trituberculatus]|uniref:Uncharacterized protein n=1 Tax=Portunus trituberculatus TaxID=210409 RepID=A0A5B7GM31_PORTR|nr:hypothetical protein [Portunus trituberculatus]